MTVSPTDAAAIANLRHRMRLTQVDFGRVIGVHARTVSKWERGEVRPQPGHLIRLAEIQGGMSDLTTYAAETEAAAAWEGQTHVLRAMDAANAAGLSAVTTYVLLPSAISAHDAGERPQDWVLSRQPDPNRVVERAIDEMERARLWPWATPADDGQAR